MKRIPYTFGIVVSAVLLAFAGCAEPRGTVSGKVTYKDKALKGGTVVFVSEDSKKLDRVEIQSDGAYSSSNVPMGNVRVAVEPASKGASGNIPKGVKSNIPADKGPEGVYGQSAANYVDIPMALRIPETSNMNFTVEKGPQTFNITLKDPK